MKTMKSTGLLSAGVVLGAVSLLACNSEDPGNPAFVGGSGGDSSVGGNETGSCTPKTCAQLDASCGFVSDGCSKALDCGGCAHGQVCTSTSCWCARVMSSSATLSKIAVSTQFCSQYGASRFQDSANCITCVTRS